MTDRDQSAGAPRLNGRVAVVTGATGGIGTAITRRMVDDGALVLATDRDQDRLDELADRLPSGQVWPIRCDLADPAERTMIIPTAVAQFGRVDILINNAADLGARTPFLDLDWDDWDRVLAANLTAPAVLSQQVARDMADHGGGVIINLTAIQERLPLLTYSPYGASKGGVSALTRSLAAELAGLGIRVNAIAPGVINTPTVVRGDQTGSATLLGRDGTPDELAAAVSFLASDEASFITGEILTVDGGRTISRSADPLAAAVRPQEGDE